MFDDLERIAYNLILSHVCSSGKCQIIHWRQGHKQICQQRCDNVINGSPGLSATEAVHQKYFPKSLNGPVVGTDTGGSWNCDDPGDPSNDPSNFAADKSQDAGTGMHSSERSPNKSKRVSFRSEDGIPFALNENCSTTVHEGTVFSENTSKEALSGHKVPFSNWSLYSLSFIYFAYIPV